MLHHHFVRRRRGLGRLLAPLELAQGKLEVHIQALKVGRIDLLPWGLLAARVAFPVSQRYIGLLVRYCRQVADP